VGWVRHGRSIQNSQTIIKYPCRNPPSTHLRSYLNLYNRIMNHSHTIPIAQNHLFVGWVRHGRSIQNSQTIIKYPCRNPPSTHLKYNLNHYDRIKFTSTIAS
ncbi:hypothetical protein, partial [Aerosakkonema funiforme]|uniref:hypothetical protein n=1 Tax=Aerosakkonema funiforme TaxID=1246630 RepID=UPI0035B7AA7E